MQIYEMILGEAFPPENKGGVRIPIQLPQIIRSMELVTYAIDTVQERIIGGNVEYQAAQNINNRILRIRDFIQSRASSFTPVLENDTQATIVLNFQDRINNRLRSKVYPYVNTVND